MVRAAFRVINKTLKAPFIWAPCGQSALCLFILRPHPRYRAAPDKRQLVVNKAQGLTELWTPAADRSDKTGAPVGWERRGKAPRRSPGFLM